MESVFHSLLMLMLVVWGVAVVMRKISLPTITFRSKQGKGFAAGELAEHLGLHFIIGAYFAGLFFEEKGVNKKLFNIVNDRLYALSYSFLGSIFFISLGFNITFDLPSHLIWFLIILTLTVIVGQILSAGLMAKRKNFTWIESLTLGVGHCARAEIAFIIASLGTEMGALDKNIFSVILYRFFTKPDNTVNAKRLRNIVKQAIGG